MISKYRSGETHGPVQVVDFQLCRNRYKNRKIDSIAVEKDDSTSKKSDAYGEKVEEQRQRRARVRTNGLS